MARADDNEPDLGARLAIGAIAGFVATMALTSAMQRLHRHVPGKASEPPVPRAGPELRLAATFAFGAACGAAIAALDPRPGKVKGVLAGGGVWLAGQAGLLPSFAALP